MKIINDQYFIGGISVNELIKKYDTPVYIYDTEKMEYQYNRLSKAFAQTDAKLNFACKALTNINVLKFFRKLGAGLDTVSINEVKLGLKAGFNVNDLVFTPNCVSLEELSEAAELGVKVNIDSLSMLDKFGAKYGNSIPVGIRLKPNVLGGGNLKISTGHVDSKFGIDVEDINQILEIIELHRMSIDGLHMHTGSDIKDLDVFLKSAKVMFEVAGKFKNLEYLDFAGGFKVSYQPSDYSTDVEQLGSVLSSQFNDFCRDYGRKLTLHFEPGKFLVSEAGYFATTVNVVKPSKNTTFACINSGLNHLIRPMFYDAYHHITNISKPDGLMKPYSVVGYICETDTFAWNRNIHEIEEGDCLVFHNAGAYCFSMASNYNSRFLPREVLIYKGKDYLIREQQSFDDLLHNQIIQDLP
ncbi:MAG TPA: diaminopimelate decarboxylase [Bacteroidales bacterium]